jgi:hypothetical protein
MVAGVFGGVAMLSLAACSNDTDPGTSTPVSSGGVTPDVAVATAALAEIRAVREAVSSTMRRFPATRSVLGSLVPLHQKHEATLVDAVPSGATPSATPAPYAVPRNSQKALAKLAVREQRLHDSLDALALRAQSGQFARLLASMGAAVHQRLAEWPT